MLALLRSEPPPPVPLRRCITAVLANLWCSAISDAQALSAHSLWRSVTILVLSSSGTQQLFWRSVTTLMLSRPFLLPLPPAPFPLLCAPASASPIIPYCISQAVDHLWERCWFLIEHGFSGGWIRSIPCSYMPTLLGGYGVLLLFLSYCLVIAPHPHSRASILHHLVTCPITFSGGIMIFDPLALATNHTMSMFIVSWTTIILFITSRGVWCSYSRCLSTPYVEWNIKTKPNQSFPTIVDAVHHCATLPA